MTTIQAFGIELVLAPAYQENYNLINFVMEISLVMFMQQYPMTHLHLFLSMYIHPDKLIQCL